MAYELSKGLETGNRIIDNEHRELFRAVNEFIDACNSQGKISLEPSVRFLLQYAGKHFAHEEDLQIKSSYPDVEAHRAFHEKYKEDLKALVLQIPPTGPTVGDLVNLNGQIAVLIDHIRVDDKKLSEYLKNT